MRNPADGKAAFNFNNEAAQDRGDTSENESNVHNVCVHPQTVSYVYIARTVCVYAVCYHCTYIRTWQRVVQERLWGQSEG